MFIQRFVKIKIVAHYWTKRWVIISKLAFIIERTIIIKLKWFLRITFSGGEILTESETVALGFLKIWFWWLKFKIGLKFWPSQIIRYLL